MDENATICEKGAILRDPDHHARPTKHAKKRTGKIFDEKKIKKDPVPCSKKKRIQKKKPK